MKNISVTLAYHAQVRAAAGVESEKLPLPAAADLPAAVRAAAAVHGDDFRKLVLDEAGNVRPSLLVLVNGVPASHGGGRPLADGDEVSLLSAVSGG